MNKLNFALSTGLLAVVLAPYWWEGFPSMAVLYALMTASSVLYGLGCLREPGNAYLWQQRKVPEAVQRLWARRMGVGYLLNAALCPLGWLLAAFVSFDTDFILLAQIVGLLLVSLLGFAPLLNTGKTSA